MPDPLFDFSDDEEESPVELFSGLDFKLVKSPSPDEDDRKKYTKLVRSTAEEYGIPKNFAVAQVHVESRYKPKAKSKANAAGLFQFIKSTGRASGLKISGKIDERYVPEKAAKAYGRHIQELKKGFKKQFPKLKDDELYFLVLSGYNWSPGKTARFARRRLAGKDAKLPTETQNYIDKIFGMTGQPLPKSFASGVASPKFAKTTTATPSGESLFDFGDDDLFGDEGLFEEEGSLFDFSDDEPEEPLAAATTTATAPEELPAPPVEELEPLPPLVERALDFAKVSALSASRPIARPEAVDGEDPQRTRYISQIAGKAAKRSLFSYAQTTKQMLESSPGDPVLKNILALIDEGDLLQIAKAQPTAMWTLGVETTYFDDAGEALANLALLKEAKSATEEDREKAHQLFNELYGVVLAKSQEYEEEGKTEKESFIGKVLRPPVDASINLVTKVTDALDASAKGIASVTYMRDTDYKGILGGEDLNPEKRIEEIKKDYKDNNPYAVAFMTAAKAFGHAGAVTGKGINVFARTLMDLARGVSLDKVISGSAYDPEEVELPQEKKEILSPKTVAAALEPLEDYLPFWTDLSLVILTDPLTYLRAPASGLKEALRSVKRIAKKQKLSKEATEQLIMQTKVAWSDAQKANNALVTDILSPGEYQQYIVQKAAPLEEMKGTLQGKAIAAAKELERAQEAARTNRVGAQTALKRAQDKVNRVNLERNVAASELQRVKAEGDAFKNFNKGVDTPYIQQPRSEILEGMDVSVLKIARGQTVRIQPVNNFYRNLMTVARRNDIDFDLIRQEFGSYGEFVDKARLTMFGKELSIPGVGPYFFYQGLRALGPQFGKIPVVGQKLEQTMATVGSGFKGLQPSGLRVPGTRIREPFTADKGELQRRASALQQKKYNVMERRLIDNFSLLPEEFIYNKNAQEWLLQNQIDVNFEVYSADGAVFAGLREDVQRRIAPPLEKGQPTSRLFRGEAEGLREEVSGYYGAPIQPERQMGLQELGLAPPRAVVTPVGEALRKPTLPVALPRLEYNVKTKTAKIIKEPVPVEQQSNIIAELNVDELLGNPAYPRIITAVGFDLDDVQKGVTRDFSKKIHRGQDPQQLIEDIIDEQKILKDSKDLEDMTVYIATVAADPSKANQAVRPLQTTYRDFKRLVFRNVEEPDLGAAWNMKYDYGPDAFLNPAWLKGNDEAPVFVDNLPGRIDKDAVGDSFFVRHLPNGNERKFNTNLETAFWARDFRRMMDEFREEFVQTGLFDAHRVAYNPITELYYPRDYIKKISFAVDEAAVPDEIFSSKPSFLKERTPEFGVPAGRLEAFSDDVEKGIGRKHEVQLSQNLSRYIRNASSKLSLHALVEATVELYGMPKSKFMEAYKSASNGRGVEAVIVDPLVGSRIKYKKGADQEIARLSDIGPRAEDAIRFRVETRANEEWNFLAKQARDKDGKQKKGGKYAIYTSYGAHGKETEYLLPASVANDINVFKDGHTFFNKSKQAFLNNQAFRAAYLAWAKLDRAAKRGLLMASPSYFSINALTDTFAISQHIGPVTPKDFDRAMDFLKDPSSVKIRIKDLGQSIPGSEVMKRGQDAGLFHASISRLEAFSGILDPSSRLEIAALRANGKGIDWSSWSKIIKSSKKLRSDINNLGLAQGENFSAYWSDLSQAVGYIKALENGHGFNQAGRMVFDALIDYSDRSRMLNFLRIFAPFATWAVKSPKQSFVGMARNPKYVSIPVRVEEGIEKLVIEREGDTYFLPQWLREGGNWRRGPKSLRPMVNIGRKLMGGNELTEDDQFFLRNRAIPLFESLQPYFTAVSTGSMNGLTIQAAPWFKAIFEYVTNENLATMQSFNKRAQLTKPFAAGTPFPRRYGLFGGPIPATGDVEGFSPFGRTAQSPDQPGMASRHFMPYFGAAPFPFKQMFTRPGLQAMNVAQFLEAGKTADPFVYSMFRPYTSPERGAEALGQTTMGLLTGFTPAIVTPSMQIGAYRQQLRLIDKGKELLREDVSEEQKTAKKQFKSAMRKIEDNLAREQARKNKK